MQKKNIAQYISQASGTAFSIKNQQSIAGGCINQTFLVDDGKRQYFVKINTATESNQKMFEAELKSLNELKKCKCLTVPTPLCAGRDATQSYLIMEYLALQPTFDQALFGEQLAQLHQIKQTHFGWSIDNSIGLTTQQNKWQSDWSTFWQQQRLGFQLQLALKNGYGGQLQQLGEKLQLALPPLFKGRTITPSLLHGDLWAGNVAGLADATPVLFDPALYYGDRETDIAMTYLFGGFNANFYTAYQNAYALDDGFRVRKTVYNIYHIINHLNLFGGSYQQQAIEMMQQVLAEVS